MPGPQITYFGITTADNHVIQPDDEDDQGNLVYTRLFGSGFFLVVEAKAGISNSPPDTRTLSSITDTTIRPDVQVLANRNMGNGSAEVCDRGPAPLTIGGVPGFNPPDFNSSQAVTDALNDFGCRLDDNTTAPCSLSSRDIPQFVKPGVSTTQVCSSTVFGTELSLPLGDTLLTVQWRDRNGNIGHPARFVIRVMPP
jgi:hypothetical protein